MKEKKILHNISLMIGHVFISGLIAILPITLTIAIFNASIRFLIGCLDPLKKWISPTILANIPYAEVLMTIIIIFVIGTLYNHFILDHFIHMIESLVKRIPLVRLVYSGIKQLVKTFGNKEKLSFQKVVLVNFPRHGIYSIGFLTNELTSDIAPTNEKKFFTIFIPTTPNPTSGFCIILPEDELIHTNLNSQEAMAMIISGGIIQPENANSIQKI
jgi:uncharacterized membrane protein